jgi:WD40 repeat protein
MKITPRTRIFNPIEWQEAERTFAFSPDGELVAVSLNDKPDPVRKNVFVYDLDGKEKYSFRNYANAEKGIAFGRDKYHLLISGNEGQIVAGRKPRVGIKSWELGASDFSIFFAGDGIHLHCASEGGRSVLAESKDNGLFCIQDGKVTASFKKVSTVSEASFSPDDEIIVIKSFDKNKTDIIRSQEPERKLSFTGTLLGFLSGGKQFMSAQDGQFCLYDAHTFEKIQDQNVPEAGRVFCGAISPDGKMIATADDNGKISIWDAESYTLLSGYLLSNQQNVSRMKFAADQRSLLVILMSGYVRQEVIILNLE